MCKRFEPMTNVTKGAINAGVQWRRSHDNVVQDCRQASKRINGGHPGEVVENKLASSLLLTLS